jgi:predicted O-methyltransferase YrrM
VLEQLKEELVECASEVNLNDYLNGSECNLVERFDESNHYYKLLVAYCKLYSPKRIIEVGFREGWSTRCMSVAAPDAIIKSFDVADQHLKYKHKYHNVEHCKVDKEFACGQIDYKSADFVFIDAPHDGDFEHKVLQRIKATHFHGIVFWDDIFFNADMVNFWNRIELPKIEISEFATRHKDGTNMGFGVTHHERPNGR